MLPATGMLTPPAPSAPVSAPFSTGVAPLSVGSFIKFGWETFKKRPWFLIGATVVWIILGWCVSLVSGFVAAFSGAFLGSEGIAGITSFAASFMLNSLLGMGWIAFTIKSHDDIASVTLSALWHPQKFWNYLATTILLWVIVVVGFILFIVPGFIALTALMFAPYLVIDKGLGPIEALKASARITKGNRLRVLGLVAAVGLVSLLGFLTLIVGILIAIPVTIVASMHAYRRLSAATDANEARTPLTGGEITLVIVGLLLPITIAVVGILASVVLASLGLVREKGREARTFEDVKMLQLSLELYYDSHNKYPPDLSAAWAEAAQPEGLVSDVPVDRFTYTSSENNTKYELCAKDPVPEGESECVSSEDFTTTTQ